MNVHCLSALSSDLLDVPVEKPFDRS
jgi:hypothetical protein